MEKQIQKILRLMALRLAQYHQQEAVNLIRIKTATWCVKGVKTARFIFLAQLGLLFLFVLLACGLVLVHLALFYGLPWPLRQRVLLMGCLGMVYTLLPVGIFFFFSRERFWMRASGADQLVRRALKGPSGRHVRRK
jgi:hypothetical protein